MGWMGGRMGRWTRISSHQQCQQPTKNLPLRCSTRAKLFLFSLANMPLPMAGDMRTGLLPPPLTRRTRITPPDVQRNRTKSLHSYLARVTYHLPVVSTDPAIRNFQAAQQLEIKGFTLLESFIRVQIVCKEPSVMGS